MSDGLSESDREELAVLGAHLLAALRRYHRGLARLEVECFMLPPFSALAELVPTEVSVVPDGDDVVLEAEPWSFRCRREAGGPWQVTAAGRTCPDCDGSGSCRECKAMNVGCVCSGTGLCARCQGIGKLIFF